MKKIMEEKAIKSCAQNTLETIFQRKSVRKFTEKPVTGEEVKTLLMAGMAAPSAVNLQSWAFICVDEKEKLKALSEQLPYAKMVAHAPLAILVCGDLSKATYGGDYWIQDCSAASQNILLAAEALGLGAVWTSTYPERERIDTVRHLLDLPDHIIPLNLIPIGHPANEDKPKDKFKPENIHFNSFSLHRR